MRITSRLIERSADWIVAHPRLILALFLAATALLGWQARRFRIDASADTLLMRDNRHYIQTQEVNRRFSPQEFILIAYEPKTHPLISEQTFADLRNISDRLRTMERVESVRSLRTVPVLALADNLLSAGENASKWSMKEQAFEHDEFRRALDGHTIYENLLINDDQTATAIQVLFKSHPELEKIHEKQLELRKKALDTGLSDAETDRLETLNRRAEPLERRLDRRRTEEVQTIRQLLKPYENRVNFYMGGVHVLGFQLIHIIQNDLAVFGGVIALIICLILLVLFRRLRWVLIPAVCCTCSVLTTMGLFGMLGLKTTVISSSFVALQLILTLAVVIHLTVQYREEQRAHAHRDCRRLVRDTLMRKTKPCFYAGLTTSVGFASLLFSGLQPVIAFGWMMIIAMGVSILISLILFPAMMAMLSRKETHESRKPAGHLLSFFSTAALRHPLWIAAIGLGVLVAGTAGSLKLKVENSFINYFRDSTAVHQELSYIDKHFGGTTPLDLVYTFRNKRADGPLELRAETVQTLHKIQNRLKQHKAVGKVLSLVNLTELARTLNNGKPITEYELTALYRGMDESLRKDLLGAYYAPDAGQARFSVRIQDTTPGLNRTALLKNIRSDIRRLGIPENDYSLTNLFVLYQDILQRLFRSQVLTLGIVYAALAVTFLLIFRSLKIALLAMIPNLFSSAAVLGVMGWAGIPLDLMTITIAAIAMGIAVDDTIHYVHRYLEEIEDHPGDEAVRRSHRSVGFAVLYTTLIITIGFATLAFSDFMPSVLFGLLTGIAMITALLADLCVLPMLLARFIRSR